MYSYPMDPLFLTGFIDGGGEVFILNCIKVKVNLGGWTRAVFKIALHVKD